MPVVCRVYSRQAPPKDHFEAGVELGFPLFVVEAACSPPPRESALPFPLSASPITYWCRFSFVGCTPVCICEGISALPTSSLRCSGSLLSLSPFGTMWPVFTPPDLTVGLPRASGNTLGGC